MTVLGAVAHDGRRSYCWIEENLTADHGIRFFAALEAEFGEDPVVMVDRAGYFYTGDVGEFVSEEEITECVGDTSVERVRNETFQAWYVPPRLPELNPVKHCCKQLDEWFNYRLIAGLDQVEAELRVALGELSESNVFIYLLLPAFKTDLKTN